MESAAPTNEGFERIREQITGRTDRIVDALTELDGPALDAPSLLPEWSRLTVACHLRYGAHALVAMTVATQAGREASYYPHGRARQRPGTLEPIPGESPRDVPPSLARAGQELSRIWSSVDETAASHRIAEPEDNPDLGPVSLRHLALLRLTEVEVHGSDLGLQLDDWSPFFVSLALPMRLEWLTTRRVNHRTADTSLEGSWLLVASDGPTYRITVSNEDVESAPSTPAVPARAVVAASSRDLLALLLGRPPLGLIQITGDTAFGEAFSSAFPGP